MTSSSVPVSRFWLEFLTQTSLVMDWDLRVESLNKPFPLEVILVMLLLFLF